jgi:glycosyltransferase involved in cell wall biosynthesis
MQTFDLIVASHLRWSFVWQRPQQLLSRLARHHRVLFVEEPLAITDTEGAPMPVLQEVIPGVVTMTPVVPESECNGTPLWLWPCQSLVARQVRDAIRALDLRHRALWFYTPTPEFMVEAVKPEMIVYDVMDELSNFKFAPPQLREQEQRLLRQAAVVFTGGASLYDVKKHFNPNTHLFASGVDAAHYSRAADPETTVPDWMEQLPTPRATYIGVIDERLDYDILRGLAEARPEVQFVMCGPVVKVDPADLPKAPNLHYPGQQAYDDLPRILKGTDVCLMPFARNEATKFISPTKTLEYMAADRPILSTPIKDVERFYSDIVFLADTPEGFVARLDAALNESEAERERKRRRIARILAEQAWDAIADNMETLMLCAWEKTPAGRRQRLSRSGQPVRSAAAIPSSSAGVSAPIMETGE